MPRTSTTTTERPPRQLLSREERQASILRAAASAFAGAGFAATSMDDVAAAAGVTKLIVYRHFGSKEELYRAVLSQVADSMHHEFVRALEVPKTERSGFASGAMLRVARDHPDGFRLLTLHAAREEQFVDVVLGFRERGIALADVLIADMIPDAVTKAWATRVIVDYMVSSVHAWLTVGEPGRDDEFVERSTDGLRGMILPWLDQDRLPPDIARSVAQLRRHD